MKEYTHKDFGISFAPWAPELVSVAGILRTAARTAVSYGGEWGCLINLSVRDQNSELSQFIQVGGVPCRRQVSSELVSVHVNPDESGFVVGCLYPPLRMEIEPFIMGVGYVFMQEISEGFVILQRDDRDVSIHSISPTVSGLDSSQ